MDRDVRRDRCAGGFDEEAPLDGLEAKVGARKTNSGGIFSPSVRVSLAIFRLFSLSVSPLLLDSLEGIGEYGMKSTLMFMLNVEDTGESGWGGELLCTSAFIRLSSCCPGAARSRSSSGCEGCTSAFPLSFSLFMVEPEGPERVCFDPAEPGIGNMMVIGARALSCPCLRFRFRLTGAVTPTRDVGPRCGDALRDEDGEALLNTAWTW
jgi:hypothetical protein